MKNNVVSDRMAKRGRPPKDVPTFPYEPANVVEIPLPPVLGLVCPCCGRAMHPRVINTSHLKRTLVCSLCGGRMVAIYSDDGKPTLVRRLA